MNELPGRLSHWVKTGKARHIVIKILDRQAKYFLLLSALMIYTVDTNAQNSVVPGVAISHISATTRTYVGSPSICILPDGNYIATHDIFGPGSDATKEGLTLVFRSSDKGATWNNIARIKGLMWGTLFWHEEQLFSIGTAKQDGNLVICSSVDNGESWSKPSVIREGIHHTAPVPVVFHKGRIWRGVELVVKDKGYQHLIVSADTDSDLMNGSNWITTNAVPSEASFLNGLFKSWVEGNAVFTPDGEMRSLLRVVTSENGRDMAAIIKISSDGLTASFDPSTGFIDFIGGARKFTVRYDKKSKRYWTICNMIKPEHADMPAASVRNTLVLKSSVNLTDWTVNAILLDHSDVIKHGFQYADWQVEGKDIIFLSRTAFDDNEGGANSYHDSNFLTFHRINNFRQLISFLEQD